MLGLGLGLVLALGLGWGNGSLGVQAAAPPPDPLETLREPVAIQPYLDRLASQITEFQLDNGLKFIVLERHRAPVVSFLTYGDVGAVDEPEGKTGVAHFLEHLAFKGTRRIGTLDYDQERILLDRLDRQFDRLQQARQQGDEAALPALEAEFNRLKEEAATFVQQNAFGQLVEQAGGVGLNASTSTDATQYFYSLPANKLELWMALESERFREPVFREFYEEKEVILEERRLRLDNSPVNQLFDAVQGAAFTVHPYGRPVIGEADDIANLTRQDVQGFFDRHYGPEHLTLAIVGDVDPQEVQRLAQRYFGDYGADRPPQPPAQPIPPEPPQTAGRSLTLERDTQPWYVVAYHTPGIGDPDYGITQVLTQVLTSGRTSRLYKALVDEQQVALAVQGLTGYPNDKYPNLTLFYGLTAPGHTLDEMAAALDQEIQRLVTEPVSEEELARVKNRIRAGLLRSLDSNSGMANLLAEYTVKTGSWRNLFRDLQQVADLTPGDLQRVAQDIFRPENATVGRLVTGMGEP